MLSVKTSIDINADKKTIWKLLSDFPNFKDWNSKTHFSKKPTLGKIQVMKVNLLGNVWLPVPVKIQTLDDDEGVRWIGGIPGAFTGSHYFQITENEDGTSTLIQGEDFEGLLVKAAWPVLEKELNDFYNAMNADLKERCEAA